MRLADLDARWVTEGGRRVGVSFLCPHCAGVKSPLVPRRLHVFFTNPPNGGPPANDAVRTWQRTGETLDSLTLSPSVDASKDGHWHGWVANGEAR